MEPTTCAYPGCDATSTERRLTCRRHWYVLRRKTRERVWDAYPNGRGSGEHQRAVDDALQELREHAQRLGVSA